jgi:hypothetical protein
MQTNVFGRTRKLFQEKAKDGSWDSWFLLPDFDDVRMSGLEVYRTPLHTSFSPRLMRMLLEPCSGARLAFLSCTSGSGNEKGRTQCSSSTARHGAMSQSVNWLSLARAASQCFQHASPRAGSRRVAALCYVNAAMIRELPAGYLSVPFPPDGRPAGRDTGRD